MSAGKSPMVSFLIPVYNAEPFVRETLDTVLAQTFPDFECIAIDDGSKDGSLSILRDFAARDDRIRVVTRPNKGLVATLNEGIDLARGEFLARLDADDLCNPRRLELQVEQMCREPDLVALGSGALAIDERGRLLGDYSNPTVTHEQIDAAHLQGHSSIHHPAAMLRASAVRQVGGYHDLVPCEDFDLWLRLAEIGRLANLPDRLISKRLLIGGLVGSNRERHDRVLLQILKDAWHRRGLPGEPKLPEQTLTTRADFFRQWGWMALKQREVGTARRYALKAVTSAPLHAESWRLMACSIRGR
jgi:glycosyltransferase involved in cell wall biosynthesis